MSRAGKLFVILVIWIFGSGWPSCALALNQILNIRHWVAPDHTRVVIDTSEDVSFTVEKGERMIAVDLEETALPSHLPRISILKKPGLEGIALSTRPSFRGARGTVLPGPVQTTVFKLKKFQDKPYRIVVDLVLPDAAKQESEARERIKVTRKARVVVIDPGHGGDAPGAVGKRGTFEKNVVLAIAKKLRDILNGKEGYRAFLTRDGDYYVSFKKRLMIAREYGADLFVSIHADAARNREVGGSSVYCLSTGAASSEAAKILARNENLADVVGGVPNGEGSDASDPIILDMFQTHTINQSRNFRRCAPQRAGCDEPSEIRDRSGGAFPGAQASGDSVDSGRNRLYLQCERGKAFAERPLSDADRGGGGPLRRRIPAAPPGGKRNRFRRKG